MPAILAIAYHSLVGSSGPGQQRVFRDRLRRQLRIDARRAEKQHLLDARGVGGPRDVRGDHQIVVEEVGRIGGIGVNAADLRRGHENGLRPGLLEKAIHLVLADQIDVGHAVAVMTVQDSRSSRRTIAEPTMPRCPAT